MLGRHFCDGSYLDYQVNDKSSETGIKETHERADELELWAKL